MNLDYAERAAAEVVSVLAPACERLEVAGSIRRRKATGIHDIELVAIPRPAALVFGRPPERSALHQLTDELRGAGRMIPRLDQRARAAWGDKFRRALWETIPLDLFITGPDQWGVIFLLRTGDADFSRALVTPEPHGALPRGYRIQAGRVWRGDAVLSTPQEGDVFDALGLPWLTPAARTRRALLAAARERRPHAPAS